MKLELSKVEILSLGHNEIICKDDVRGMLYGQIRYEGKDYDAVFYGNDYDYSWDAGQLDGLYLESLDSIEIDGEEVDVIATDEEVKNFLKELGA